MRWRRYLWHHVMLLLVLAAFAVYGLVTTRLLPFGVFHCFMHDVLHLYCPFCGGTRAFLACLRLDPVTALVLNPAVVLATLAFLALDLRALVLLLRHREGALFPRFLAPFAVVWFSLYTVLRNALAFFGIDPVGDIAPYWADRLTLPLAVAATCLLLLVVLALLGAFYLRQGRLRFACAWLTGAFAVFLAAVLFSGLWLLLCVPLGAALALVLLLRNKKVSQA